MKHSAGFGAFVWGTALIILLGAAVLAGRASQAPIAAPAPKRPLVAEGELARCRTAGPGDETCYAAWDAAREGFFGRPAS